MYSCWIVAISIILDALLGTLALLGRRLVFVGAAGEILLNFVVVFWGWWRMDWFGVARRAWVTHALAVSALVAFAVAAAFGWQDDAVAVLGVQLGKEWTFLSHAIVHIGWYHLAGNIVVLEIFDPFVERWIRPAWYILLIFLATASGAFLSAELATEHWDDGNNPVGMSTSVYAIAAAGWYLAARRLILPRRRKILTLFGAAKREWVSWSSLVVASAVVTFFLWADSDVTTGPTAVGHTTGAIVGLLLVLGNAVYRTWRAVRESGANDWEGGEP